jgi:hypothetical protein
VKINIQIERLVLDGINLTRRERPQVQSAFENELARLVASAGLNHDFSTGGSLASLGAAKVQMAKENNPERIGHQIAQAVYKGMGQ